MRAWWYVRCGRAGPVGRTIPSCGWVGVICLAPVAASFNSNARPAGRQAEPTQGAVSAHPASKGTVEVEAWPAQVMR